MSLSVDRLPRIRSRLEGLKESLPCEPVRGELIDEYHRIFKDLDPELEIDEIRIPVDWQRPTLNVLSADYRQGSKEVKTGGHVQRDLFLLKLNAILGYFRFLRESFEQPVRIEVGPMDS